MTRIVLASTSKYRRELLQRLIPHFECVAPKVDEESYHSDNRSPAQVAVLLAAAKAEQVAQSLPDAIVIGSDQVVDLDGKILGKPGTADRAVAQLSEMSGRSHRLLTAVCICSPGQQYELLHVTTLHMRELTRAEIQRYVDRDQPLDCAGSYKIESLGIALFDSIQTTDFTSIMGLPLMPVARQLRAMGIDVP